ncbi:MAG: nickel-iron hydrogenase, nickel incorporation protein [Pseudomonadota bacterium]
MCNTCGCNLTDGNRHLLLAPAYPKKQREVSAEAVLHGLLDQNDRQARSNREILDAHGILVINLMSSPGAGKTTLLETTIKALQARWRIGVIEGDLETENDAMRIRAHGVPVVQITTGTACHLDAHLLAPALAQMPLEQLDILFVENVGNLVCPASFDLGHHLNVTLLSFAEGDDKPAKYPVMFRAADLLLITKQDLQPYMDDFSPDRAEACLRQLASDAPLIILSGRSGMGMDAWLAWLDEQLARHRASLARGESTRPRVERAGRILHHPAEVVFRAVRTHDAH